MYMPTYLAVVATIRWSCSLHSTPGETLGAISELNQDR
jgi:hypothetical protein